MFTFHWRNWLKRASGSWQRDERRTRRGPRPLTYRRLEVERLEDRTLLSVTLLNNYTGLGSAQQSTLSGFLDEPPDTNGAAGPNSYVETVNQAVSIYTAKTTGSGAVTDSLADFYFTQGGLPPLPVMPGDTDEQTDCFVIFDPLVQRFIVGDIDVELDSSGNLVNNGANALLLAVSTSANPTTLTSSDWFFYDIPTSEAGVAVQDYPGNPGYNADALVVTFQSFDDTGATNHSQVNAISMTSLINGTPLTLNTDYFQTDVPNFELRPTAMQDSVTGDPMWLVAAANGGFTGGNTIDVLKMTNVLSAAPVFTTTTLSVNPYSVAAPELQPDGTAITVQTDSRILNAAEMNGTIVAGHTVSDAVGDLDNARWYSINVSSGTPVLQDQGDVSGGSGVYDAYPGVSINAQGDIGMSFIQSGTSPGQFMSTYVTGRTPADPAGTMEAPVLVQAGVSNYTGSREGDLSGINVDSDGTFWISNEIANNDAVVNWGTAIGHFTLSAPLSIVLTTATEGIPFTNVPVATFVDNSGVPLSSYSATILWGDGSTSAGQVVAGSGAGNFIVLGSHTYLEEGKYTLTASVFNGTITLGPASGIVTVNDAPLIAGPSQTLNSKVGSFLSDALLATFTDTDTSAEQPSNYRATISWFEAGSTFTTTGTIVALGNNTFAVYGSSPFSFATGGTFNVRVVINDIGGASVIVNDHLNVANNPAIPPLLPMFQADIGPRSLQFTLLQDTLTNLIVAERLFIDSLFGPVPNQVQVIPNLINAFIQYEFAVLRFDVLLPNGSGF